MLKVIWRQSAEQDEPFMKVYALSDSILVIRTRSVEERPLGQPLLPREAPRAPDLEWIGDWNEDQSIFAVGAYTPAAFFCPAFEALFVRHLYLPFGWTTTRRVWRKRIAACSICSRMQQGAARFWCLFDLLTDGQTKVT
jgi:hypothetical protein